MKKLFATICLAALLAIPASASIIAIGSVSFTSAVATYTGPDLADATSVSLVGGTASITTALGTFAGLTPVFPAVTALASVNPLVFLIPPPPTVDFIRWADIATPGRFEFLLTSASKAHVTLNDLEILATGTFRDSLGIFGPGPATLLVNMTQTGGPGTAISLSGTIAVDAPEPSFYAGVGLALLAGAIALRRRRNT